VDRQVIQKCIDYIEENLKTEISAVELGSMSGYSLFHFYRLFQTATGMPVMQYITRRKLLNAIWEIASGKKMIDTALEYGFGTYAGFYKSFVRETGYTPAHYMETCKVKKPCRINILQKELIMISQKKASEMLKYWGLENEKIADIVYEETGHISGSAKYAGEKYILKYTPDLGRVKKAISIAEALESVGLSSPGVLRTKDGADCIRDGELYFFVTRRMTGERLKAGSMYMEGHEEKARFIGEIIGQLSLALKKADVITDDTDTYGTVAGWALPKLKGKLSVDPKFIDSTLQNSPFCTAGCPVRPSTAIRIPAISYCPVINGDSSILN